MYMLSLLMFWVSPALADDLAIIPLPTAVSESDFRPFSPQRARLGQLLFYDKLLSGNRNIACATCHHHGLASADGLSLGLGEGGVGLGLKRTPGAGESAATRRIQRNAPALFNLGAKEFQVLFHDGRLSIDTDNAFHKGFNSPALEFLPEGLQSLLAAQAVFPLISEPEMAGHIDENEIAGARNRRFDYAWALVAKRVQNVPVYAQQFMAAFDDIEQGGDIKIHHIANALDDFMNAEWRTLHSPFDAYLRGNESALNTEQLQGMKLFYGKAQCATCHAGKLQTDHQFHSIALPQFGPGRTRQFDFKARDMGRINESDRPEDAYRFRTPSLRNVTATAPYGHNGAYKDLRGIVEHHLDPLGALERWTPEQLVLPRFDVVEQQDFLIQWDEQEQHQIRASVDIQKIELAAFEVDAVLAFLGALTDEYSLAGRLGEPDREKFSGLLLEDSIAQ